MPKEESGQFWAACSSQHASEYLKNLGNTSAFPRRPGGCSGTGAARAYTALLPEESNAFAAAPTRRAVHDV
ncbi:hypothetical protein GB937_010467 [Aspergillus fischeri]|nr:hypothetical protein GB937_010467 [Aspergillus fischeri]